MARFQKLQGPVRLGLPKADVEQLIDRHHEEGLVLRNRGGKLLEIFSEYPDYDALEAGYEEWKRDLERWHALTAAALQSAYTTSAPSKEFLDAALGTITRRMNQGILETIRYRNEATEGGLNTLRSLKERLEYLPGVMHADSREGSVPSNRAIFIVHGRDEALREKVARVLERLNFEPIILSEHPNQGKTLIEKFESKALDVGFAVVLLTPDDRATGPDERDSALPNEGNRARQNVILELGYFMGSLGRERVAAIYKPGTELPTDIHGLGYIPLDEGGAWQFKLGAELAAARYEVDLNLLRG